MVKKLTPVFLTVCLACLPSASIYAHTGSAEQEEKQYVVVIEEETTYEGISDEIDQSTAAKLSGLEEERVVAARLTEEEADALNEAKDVIVEEDIILSGSTAEEWTAEEAGKRKAEIKQKKQEALDDMEEESQEETEYEWNLQAVNADGISEESDVPQKVKVAVLDSGVDYVTGVNLAGYVNLIEGEEELSEIFQDATGHGTGIASIISGNGETGILGVNPNAEVYSAKVLDGENKAPLSRIIQGIYWCIEHKMNIINMSFGTPVYSRALEQAVKDADAAGLLMVGAAGNGGGGVEYPAAFPEVMAVASVNPEAEVSTFSNTGEELDVAAPGEKVRVASFFDGNEVTHGTSIAAPHVTGAASLLWEKDLTKPNEFIRQLIQESAKSIEGTDACGLLDVGYAEQMYDVFAEKFEEGDAALETKIPENTKAPESFEDVNTDETYVEGRWKGSDHKGAVDKGGSGLGFSSAVISIIKQDAVYPDQNTDWAKGEYHPWWHGRWETTNTTVKRMKHTRINWDVNYAAVLEMVTEIALEGGEVKSYMTYDWFRGMDPDTYAEVKNDIIVLKSKFGKILKDNKKINRKYFLFGCAIHSITDAFAHSTTRPDGTRIAHTGDPKQADDVNYYSGRYKMAIYATKNILKALKDDCIANGDEVLRAIKKKCLEGDVKFKIIKAKPYLNANGFEDAILDQININARTG